MSRKQEVDKAVNDKARVSLTTMLSTNYYNSWLLDFGLVLVGDLKQRNVNTRSTPANAGNLQEIER